MAKTAKVTMDDLLAGSEESFKHVVAGDTVNPLSIAIYEHGGGEIRRRVLCLLLPISLGAVIRTHL